MPQPTRYFFAYKLKSERSEGVSGSTGTYLLRKTETENLMEIVTVAVKLSYFSTQEQNFGIKQKFKDTANYGLVAEAFQILYKYCLKHREQCSLPASNLFLFHE